MLVDSRIQQKGKKKKVWSWNIEAVVQMEEQVEFGQKKDLVHPPISVDEVTAVDERPFPPQPPTASMMVSLLFSCTRIF